MLLIDQVFQVGEDILILLYHIHRLLSFDSDAMIQRFCAGNKNIQAKYL